MEPRRNRVAVAEGRKNMIAAMRNRYVLLIFLSLVIIPATHCLAQDDDPHAHHGAVGYIPREVLERPLTLRVGIGKVNEPVSTKSQEAQAFYNQGVAYLHSYVWLEAARSFHQSLRLDPNIAMAWIGLSRAYTGLEDSGAAATALAKAQALAGESGGRVRLDGAATHANEWEKRRIAIRALQVDALADLGNKSKHEAYKRAMDDALAVYPNDLELWLLRGNSEEPTAAGRGQRGGIAAIAFYSAVLLRDPENFAAHHYLIHSYETVNRMPEALYHGEIYERLAPAIPHAHHMYGHDLRRVGRIDEAIAKFQKADDIERAYYASENVPSDFDWHHQHNLDLLSTSYQYEGRLKTAGKLMVEAWAIPAVSEYAEFNKKEWPAFLLSRGRVAEARAASDQLIHGKWPAGRTAGHIMMGHALLADNRLDEARRELEAAQKEIASTGDVARAMSMTAQPFIEGLQGEILLRSGKRSEADAILEEVQRKVRAVPGPDAWSQALFKLEFIARVARETGDWDLAEFTAQQMQQHDPEYAGTSYALALVAEHKGDGAGAKQGFSKAAKLWSKADPDMVEVVKARGKSAAE
jgi:tetratricopeptide (TPR) repeat protein